MGFLLTKKLKYFMTVMEKRCLTKASEELFITRSPLGKAINELETILGNKLFIRQHGQLEPTEFALSIHSEAEPLYKKIIELEKRLTSINASEDINIIFDSHYPGNLIDIVTCSLKNSNIKCRFDVIELQQAMFDNSEFDRNTLILSHRSYEPEENMVSECYPSSGLVLLISKEIEENPQKISRIPILLRENTDSYAPYIIKERLEPLFGSPLKVRFHKGTLVDFLMMTANGEGLMILPIKVCDLLKVNRSNAIFLNDCRFKTYYYHPLSKKTGNQVDKAIKYIKDLL
ncbi:LysR family transcriptional regulator [Franconibacter pulveris 601]|uniref:LysR family transcriptional regulator n=1 Tax=Franconibacter pulveris TaxID=435910 RepID=UPI00046640B8|nr:LysR family transcriptional regulator [Franconibacter pulveris]